MVSNHGILGGFGFHGAAYLCLPEPLREDSLAELSFAGICFAEDSIGEVSFEEESFEELSDLPLSSFFSLEEESLLPEAPGDEDFLA